MNLLLDRKPDVNAEIVLMTVPRLCVAAQNGHTVVVKLLLYYRADVNASRHTGATPLHISSWKGHTEVVKLLLDHKADVNASGTYDGSTWT